MNTWQEIKKHKFCYLWISPFYILFLLFTLVPAIYGLYISFTDYTGFGTYKMIGFDNYVKCFTNDPVFWKSLWNTFVLWLLIVPMRTLLALILASILNSSRAIGRKVYTVVILLPYITAIVVAASIFRMIFATEGGIFNNMLESWFGIAPIGWLDTARWSKVSVAIMNIWRMTGYLSLVLLAGMQKISVSVNEAAELDGAGSLKKFVYITIPLLKQEIFFVVLMSTIWVFQNIADVMVLTKGGPMNSSINLVLHIYNNAYTYSKMGYASAMSYVLFVLLVVLSGLANRNNMRKEG